MPGGSSSALLGPENFNVPVDVLDYGQLENRTTPFETRLEEVHEVLKNVSEYQTYIRYVLETQIQHAEKKCERVMSKQTEKNRKSFQNALDLIKTTVKTFQEKQKKVEESLRVLYEHQYDLQQETRHYKRNFITEAMQRLRYDPNTGTADPMFTSPVQLAVRSGYTHKPDAKRKLENRNIFTSQPGTLVGDSAGILPVNLTTFSPSAETQTKTKSPVTPKKRQRKSEAPTPEQSRRTRAKNVKNSQK